MSNSKPNKDKIKALIANKKRYHKKLSATNLSKSILLGNIQALSETITLLESKKSKDNLIAQEVIQNCLPKSGNSIRIGITGVPGVGKSTFIESFGLFLISLGKKVAVLAIDPSSEKSGGSILGDKTRMESLSVNPNAFIRPSAAGNSLGGVAQKTRESIFLCEACGFDIILIETVGVGQSEIAVHSMTDFFLLLMLAGAGDELQGIKRGIMEMADTVLIAKTDGDNIKNANRARLEYKNALHLMPPNENNWIPKVETISALENNGIEKVWKIIDEFNSHTKSNQSFYTKRKNQNTYWMNETLKENILRYIYQNPKFKDEKQLLEKLIQDDKITSFSAADKLFNLFKKINQ